MNAEISRFAGRVMAWVRRHETPETTRQVIKDLEAAKTLRELNPRTRAILDRAYNAPENKQRKEALLNNG